MDNLSSKKNSYKKQLISYINEVRKYNNDEIYDHTIECSFESLSDWSTFHNIDYVKEWFIKKRKNSSLEIQNIPLQKMKNWMFNEDGNIVHSSKDFFIVRGLRVTTETREKSIGWDQPILEQVGYDGGLLGIIRKRFEGIPHYLCEAKEEPGNYGKVQISPTLQATFANLNQSHGGRKPRFSELFLNRNSNQDIKILFDSWLSEDGGRLHLKRNRGILIEVSDGYEIRLPDDNFIWLSLYQIKQLLKEDAWINPHIRGILAHV